MAQLSMQYTDIRKTAEFKLSEIRSEYQDLASYFHVSVREGRIIQKALQWTSDIKSTIQHLTDCIKDDRNKLRFRNHITPPSWSFHLSPGNQNIVILSQNFLVIADKTLSITYERPVAQFIVTVKNEGSDRQFVLGQDKWEVVVDLASQECELIIRPVSYKDAYDAVAFSMQ
jgi:hypothetical protein